MEASPTKKILRAANRVAAIGFITYALIYGLLCPLPMSEMMEGQLGQTARNIFYHVPMWFAMMVMGYSSVVYSIMFLRHGKPGRDIQAKVAARLTVLFGALGLITGSAWSRVTWGANADWNDFAAWWVWDPKQVSALICVLLYAAYFLLRSSFEEPVQKARISAVYNIFAAASIYPLFYILPKALDGLHPGAKGEGSTIVDMSPEFYQVFWPSVIGFIMLAVWLLDLGARTEKARHAINEMEV